MAWLPFQKYKGNFDKTNYFDQAFVLLSFDVLTLLQIKLNFDYTHD